MQKLAEFYSVRIGVEKDEEETKRLYIGIYKRVLEELEWMKWTRKRDFEWGFDDKIGRFVI